MHVLVTIALITLSHSGRYSIMVQTTRIIPTTLAIIAIRFAVSYYLHVGVVPLTNIITTMAISRLLFRA